MTVLLGIGVMDEMRETTELLLNEKPSLKSELYSVLEVDADEDGWKFEDIPLDSGAFGEIVSRGIVEKTDNGYRISNRDAVLAALEQRPNERGEKGDSDRWTPDPNAGIIVERLERIRWPEAAGVVGSLVLLIGFRLVPYGSVFRDGFAVLSSNDPYFYRYWTTELVRGASGPFDFGILANLPPKVATGEPLLVATLWWFSSLSGGDAGSVGTVMAWYPVIATLVGGVVVYFISIIVSGDSRIGIASVSLLAVIPAHGIRTGLGFADHHAFDYMWLALTLLALVVLADRRSEVQWTIGAAALLGFSVAGQTLAWDNSPVLLIPLGLYISAVLTSELRAPSDSRFPIGACSVGLLIGTFLVGIAHLILGWHSTVVAVFPSVLFVGTVALVGLRSVVWRFRWTGPVYIALQGIFGVIGVIVTASIFPSFIGELQQGLSLVFGANDVVEATSIFGEPFGPFLGPILLTGFALFLVIPYLGWVSSILYRAHDPVWLAPVVYSWYILCLSFLQVRFLGELAVVASLFAGLAFVHLASWVDLARTPKLPSTPDSTVRPMRSSDSQESELENLELPSRRDALNIAGLWLGVASFGAVLTPLKHSQVTIDDEMYAAATWMRKDAEERGWTYPDNYVFSHWNRNRMFNFFVNGQSESYGYARANFEKFVSARPVQAHDWYDKLKNKVGYIVVQDRESVPESIHGCLRRYGSAGDGGAGIGNFRAFYETPGGGATVFTPVPGVTLTGNGPSEGEILGELRQSVDIKGATFEYERTVRTNEFGIYETSIQYPGVYSFNGDQIRLTEQDILDGRKITDFDATGLLYWSFDEGTGDVAYDRAGGHHLRGVDGHWTSEASGSAIAFEGEEPTLQVNEVPLNLNTEDSVTISFQLQGDLVDVNERYPRLLDYDAGRSGFQVIARNQVGDFGILIDDVDGNRIRNFSSERRRFRRWTEIIAILNREEGTLDLYRDGDRIGSKEIGEFGPVAGPGSIKLGDLRAQQPIHIDEVRIRKGVHPPA